MKIRFENSYWPNAIGVIGVAFAIALCFRGCSNILIEREKTEQIKITHEGNKIHQE